MVREPLLEPALRLGIDEHLERSRNVAPGEPVIDHDMVDELRMPATPAGRPPASGRAQERSRTVIDCPPQRIAFGEAAVEVPQNDERYRLALPLVDPAVEDRDLVPEVLAGLGIANPGGEAAGLQVDAEQPERSAGDVHRDVGAAPERAGPVGGDIEANQIAVVPVPQLPANGEAGPLVIGFVGQDDIIFLGVEDRGDA
jgi:hypothetical protein